jgi:prephenate dehydrogenase
VDEPGFTLRDATVAIVGLGLMGGSLALALRERNVCRRIVAVTSNAATREQLLARGIVDEAGAELERVSTADLIVLAAPVRTIVAALPRVGAIAHAGAIVIDLGSTKREIVDAMESLPAQIQPIGGHPMCGKEKAGFSAADVNLYHDAVFVLTPLARTSADTLALAKTLAEAVGARPLVLDPARHDRITAAISHLPCTLATALMLTADEHARDDESTFALAASGFRDTTRLAASDVTMMLDILLTNRENVAALMRACSRWLDHLAELIADGDESALRAALERAATKRRELFPWHLRSRQGK